MTTTIVTGVDGSDTALEAARQGARLATALRARLYVLSAYGNVDNRRVQAEAETFVLNPKADAFRAAEAAAQQLRVEFPGLSVDASAAEGKPAEALVYAAEQLGADLIVVGNKRVQGLSRILGSIATAVAHKSPCDVYIAHTHQH